VLGLLRGGTGLNLGLHIDRRGCDPLRALTDRARGGLRSRLGTALSSAASWAMPRGTNRGLDGAARTDSSELRSFNAPQPADTRAPAAKVARPTPMRLPRPVMA
jgi:hypothetical protein